MTKRPPTIPTLTQLNRFEPHWVWIYCPCCRHQAAAPLVPFIIRWGVDASSDKLRNSARCTGCGRRGALIQMPSYSSALEPYRPFPVGQGLRPA